LCASLNTQPNELNKRILAEVAVQVFEEVFGQRAGQVTLVED
jgi:hypothetical protein